ncbi:T9SS type A sorting domain-containing protein [Hymenobacter lucidus]|uniref:T9SS type A sorting domain-containing protein n=1 Tax=Hymenobacter lucidus TaxID=2880930 RepID=A0ABS8ARG6_9BACT|nr:T9SS type A sorting domain-containing protein [Hymenobacter lucidus]MCB2408785.1 T9SS type A sorting domain-containing protein [Hymenobacter lucidus]
MRFSTRSILTGAAGILCSLALSAGARAQTTPPAWLSARSIGNSQFSSAYPAPVVDKDGNTYRAGTFSAAVTIAGSQYACLGSSDAYVVKLDAAGNQLWLRLFSTSAYEFASGLALDKAGNVYVNLAVTNRTALGNNVTLDGGSYVVRFSPLGEPAWAQKTGPTTIAVDDQDHVYLTSTFQNTYSLGGTTLQNPGTGLHAQYLGRLSATTGAVQLLQLVGHYPPPGPARFNYYSPMIAVAPAGNVFLLNRFEERIIVHADTFTTRGFGDVLITRYTSQGGYEWVRQYGGAGRDYLEQAVADASGNLYLTGSFDQTATFGTLTATTTGAYDAYLVKYSTEGAAQWVQTGGGPSSDYWNALTLDAAGNPYVAGTFFNQAKVGTAALVGAGSNDIMVAAYTAAGQLRWVQQAGGPANDASYGLGIDAAGIVYLYGDTPAACSFGAATVTAASRVENYLARLASTPLATKDARPQALGLYPNPATDRVQLPALPTGTRVQLVDALGRVAREAVVSAAGQVSVRGLVPGLYTLRATTTQGQALTGRLVVE